MALGLKAGVDIDLMIKAIANGSGGSTQFGIRAPWMAQRKFKPVQGSPALLVPLLRHDRQTGPTRPASRRRCSTAPSSSISSCVEMGLAETHDVAVMIDVLNDPCRDKKHDQKDTTQ